MSARTFAIIDAVPLALQLVVGVLGLVFSTRGRANGVADLPVGAFVVMLASTSASLVWQFVSVDVPFWMASSHLTGNQVDAISTGVDVLLGVASAVSWLLVVLAVSRAYRRRQRFGPAAHAGPVNHPMAAVTLTTGGRAC